MKDPLEHARQWAEAIDSNRTTRPSSGAEIVFPVCAGVTAFFIFYIALMLMAPWPIGKFSLIEWLIAMPAYSGVAIVAVVWPDRAALAVCASIATVVVLAPVLYLAALAGTDGHSNWQVMFPWPLVAIPFVVASLFAYVGARVGDVIKERARARLSSSD
jgi:hypothetical protein